VTVATLPWTPVSRVVAAAGGGDRDGLFDRAAALLLATARGLRQEIDGPAVLLAHWAVSGASTPDGLATELFREPVLDVGELEGQGWDAVVLGHVHKPQLLGSEDAAGPMLYVGSPLPLTHGEAACDHGVWIYDTEGLPSARFLPVSSRRFVTLDYGDLAAEANGNIAGLVALSDGLGWDPPLTDAIVRLRYTSTEEQARGIDTAALKRALLDAGAWRATVEPRIVREQTARVAGMTSDLDPARALELYLAERGVEDRDGLLALHQEYMAEIA
jgi:exonuclease SbcD